MHIFVAHPFPSLKRSAPEPSKLEGCWFALRRCASQQIFGACLFSAIFGLIMFGRNFQVRYDSVYRWQQYRPKI